LEDAIGNKDCITDIPNSLELNPEVSKAFPRAFESLHSTLPSESILPRGSMAASISIVLDFASTSVEDMQVPKPTGKTSWEIPWSLERSGFNDQNVLVWPVTFQSFGALTNKVANTPKEGLLTDINNLFKHVEPRSFSSAELGRGIL
jgi:hypothetical protein